MRRLSSLVAVLVAVGLFLAGPASAHHLPEQAADRAVVQTHGPDGLRLDPRGPAAADAPYDVDAHAPWAASQWDGGTFTTDQPDLTTLPTVHAIYMYPSDKPSRFSQFAAMFQADARDASRLMGHGRAVRWDERLGADGITRYVDITVIRSSQRSNKLGGANQFSLVGKELSNRGFTNPNKKYAVWLDANSRYCGQGQFYQDPTRAPSNYNERRLYGVVYRPYATGDPLTGGFCRGRVLMHELGHTMGAVLSNAPNESDGAHCNDSAEDVMCYRTSNPPDTGSAIFDYSSNDYWDPAADPSIAPEDPRYGTKLGWWTVNLSRFLCPTSDTCSQPNNPAY
jgi:hypothetical protein